MEQREKKKKKKKKEFFIFNFKVNLRVSETNDADVFRSTIFSTLIITRLGVSCQVLRSISYQLASSKDERPLSEQLLTGHTKE